MADQLAFDDWHENPETLAERRRAALETMAELSQWPHCNHTWDMFDRENLHKHNVKPAGDTGTYDFDHHATRAVRLRRVPDFVLHNPKYQDRHGPIRGYDWQLFVGTVAKTINHTREGLSALLEQKRHELAEGVGMPSATDGSKGQWRAAKQATISTLEWLVGEYEPRYDEIEVVED